jgi:hypothetical protein
MGFAVRSPFEKEGAMSDIAKRFKKEIAELSGSSKKVGDLGYASSHGGNLS